MMCDRYAFDRDVFRDQVIEIGQRSAQTSVPGVENRFLLLLGCLRVHIADALPAFGREHVSRNLEYADKGKAADVETVDLAFFDIVRQERVARATVGIFPRSEERRVGKECRSRWS